MAYSLVIPDVSARRLYEYRVAGKSPEEVGGNYGRAMRVLIELGVERREDMTYPEFVEAVRSKIPDNIKNAFKIAYSLVSAVGKVTPDSLYSVARRLKRVGIRKVTLGFLLSLLKGIKIPGPARIPTGSFDDDPVIITLNELGGIAKVRDVKKRLENKGFKDFTKLLEASFLAGKFYPIPEGKRSPTLPSHRYEVLKIALAKGTHEETTDEYIAIRVDKDKLDEKEMSHFESAMALGLIEDRDTNYLVKVPIKDSIRIISKNLL